jgi:prepilin-type N-terminal cleavage/methylation domain-containing protein
MMYHSHKIYINNYRGFTLIELLVVMAILGIITAISFAAMKTYSQRQVFTQFNTEASSLVTTAQHKAIAVEAGTGYGVYFSGATIELFPGDTVTVGSSANTIVSVPSYVRVINELPGAVSSVVFEKRTGMSSVSGAIHLVDDRTVSTSTITFTPASLIE